MEQPVGKTYLHNGQKAGYFSIPFILVDKAEGSIKTIFVDKDGNTDKETKEEICKNGNIVMSTVLFLKTL